MLAGDVEALAIVAYNLIVYQPLKHLKNAVDITLHYENTRNKTRKFKEIQWNSVSQNCKQLLMWMLNEDPCERPTIIQIATH